MMTDKAIKDKLKFYDDFLTALETRMAGAIAISDDDKKELKRVLRQVKKALKALDKA